MDPIKILKRAWDIVWNYRTLWIFGFILALTASGSSGGNGNSGSRYTLDGSEQFNMPGNMEHEFNNAGEAMEEFFTQGIPEIERSLGLPAGELNSMLWVGVAFIIFMVLWGLAMAVVRYVTENATIRMVDKYEVDGQKLRFKEGWRLGWNPNAWKLFLIDLLVSLPMLIFFFIVFVAGIMLFKDLVMSHGSMSNDDLYGLMGFGIFIAVLFVIVLLLSVFLRLLRHFFWRKAALGDQSVNETLSEGWQLFRENWKDIGIMWLVMIGVGIAWAIANVILAIVALPAVAITVIAGAIIAVIPGLLLVGVFSLFLSSYLPWIAGGLFVLPLFFIVGFAPWIFLSGFWLVYTSTVWTLVYRELSALPSSIAPLSVENLELDA